MTNRALTILGTCTLAAVLSVGTAKAQPAPDPAFGALNKTALAAWVVERFDRAGQPVVRSGQYGLSFYSRQQLALAMASNPDPAASQRYKRNEKQRLVIECQGGELVGFVDLQALGTPSAVSGGALAEPVADPLTLQIGQNPETDLAAEHLGRAQYRLAGAEVKSLIAALDAGTGDLAIKREGEGQKVDVYISARGWPQARQALAQGCKLD